MPRPSKRKQAARNRQRNEHGHFDCSSIIPPAGTAPESIEPEVDDSVSDWNLLNLTEDMVRRATQLPLVWKNNAGSYLRGVYTKDSRTTVYRRDKANKKAAEGSAKIDSYFSATRSISQQQQIDDENEPEVENISSLLTSLSNTIKPMLNRESLFNKNDAFHLCKLQAVYRYYQYRSKGFKKIESSRQAAVDCWISPSEDYRAKAIRFWAKQYQEFGFISKHGQGRHSKRESLLSDEKAQEQIRNYVALQKPEQRTLPNLLKFVNETVVPDMIGILGSVPHTTLWRYMVEWGYSHRKNSKDVYYDGHEREDVVAYRREWSKRMMRYKEQMETYAGDDMTAIPPSLAPGQKQIVMVTHDESTFYANDGKQKLWLAENETILRNKSPGRSIMVSEFQCPCHGTMRSLAWTSRTYFEAGTHREQWWTSRDMVKQLEEDAIPLFELLHPNCQALFVFDQSSNHNAYASNALRVAGMPKDRKLCGTVNADHDCSTHKYRDGYYTNPKTGEKIIQSMYKEYAENIKKRKRGVTIVTADKQNVCYFKGVQLILEERGLWLDEDTYRPKKKWRMDCKADAEDDNRCCALHCLSAQPDFREQKTALRETVENAGHIFELYPKYHCECNWIERYWGSAKRTARANCDYSFKALKENLPSFLDAISPADEKPIAIRRFFGRAWRFIEAYSQDIPTAEAMNLVERLSARKYTSHRRIGKYD